MVTKVEADLMRKINRAINSSIKLELDILRDGRIERTFTASFANQITEQIKDSTLRCDPFCNKHLGITKRLNDKVIELDIAVHKRHTDEKNIVVIELETTNRPIRDDVWKIEEMTQGEEIGGYGYKLGLYVVFGIREKAGHIITQEWYKNGKLVLNQSPAQ